LVASVLAALVLSACVNLPRQAFTAGEQARATPVGFNSVRWIDGDPALAESLRQTLTPGAGGILNVIALSGGGANGAFGAGLMSEWSKTGGRPEFQLVTGVSVGGLSAPFVFLGRTWDEKLTAAYFDGRLQHLLQSRGPLGIFTPGLYSKRRLKALVKGYVTDELITQVAAEHAKGRRLLVATTDLDTEDLVIWDMGAIATHGGPAARKLFADVLVASASVPVIFAPSLIAVQSGTSVFNELHVDGQAENAFYGIPQTLLLGQGTSAAPYKVKFYVIVNGSLDSTFQITPRSTIPLALRTYDATNKASLRLLTIANAEFCHAYGCDFYVAALPRTVVDDPLDFSPTHIQALFDAGKAAIDRGDAWRSSPQTSDGIIFH
jgi:hypothetical protein